MIEKIGGRKFVLTMIVIAVGTAVQILSPHGVTDAFVALLVGVSAAFGATNAIVSRKAIDLEMKQIEGSETVAAEPVTAQVDFTPVNGQLAALNSQIATLQEVSAIQAQALTGLQQGTVITQNLVKAILSNKV